jgi:glycosyltransferase involved in cell wall biosynthesis
MHVGDIAGAHRPTSVKQMSDSKKRICWITPDYFMAVDSSIVPQLSQYYEIDWVVINTYNTKLKSNLQRFDTLKPREYNLRYRQRDPRIIWQYFELLSSVRNADVDVVYVSFHGLPYFFPVLFLLIDINKVIYGAHNVNVPQGAVHEGLMRAYQNYMFKKIKHYHVFSKYQLSVISRLLPAKNHYYAPFVMEEPKPTNTCLPGKTIRFLFFGYIRKYKRLDLLINAFQDLYNSGFQQIELSIAGSCDNWEYYQSMITISKGIESRIEIIPDEDIPDLISSCHYLVLPYQYGTQSGVLRLAYQYNKPVIASDIDAFRQFVINGSTGFLFKSGSQDNLTAVMRDAVLTHETNYSKLRENIENYVKQELSLEQIIAKYSLFLDACGNHDTLARVDKYEK